MRLFLGLLLIFVLSSCKHEQNDNRIIINLNDLEDAIEYSSFVDSVSYLTLCLEEPIGEVERIYKRGDYYYVQGDSRFGIFIFDKFGKLYSHINSYGEGPEDYRMISSFAVVASTGDVCILDYASQQTKYYGMDGSFKYSVPCPNWSVDLAAFNLEHTICISPFYVHDDVPSGIWLADKDNKIVRYLSDDVTPEHRFYYFPMTYNMSDTCLYYYDRNWNYFSRVSEHGQEILFQFDVKQKIPRSVMKEASNGPLEQLDGYAICDRFLYSPDWLLMLYCRFNEGENEERSYVWTIMDNHSRKVRMAHELVNDMDGVEITNHDFFFHLDDRTWGRICDEEAEKSDICLQLLYVK